MRYFAVACVGALSAIALHSFADFKLYIPANAMIPAWTAGMAVGVELRVTRVNLLERLAELNVAMGKAVEIDSCRRTYR